MSIPNIPSSFAFFLNCLFRSPRNIVHTCCDQRGGTNWANTLSHTYTHADACARTHTHTQQKPQQGSELGMTKERNNTVYNIRLNTATCIQIKRFIRLSRVCLCYWLLWQNGSTGPDGEQGQRRREGPGPVTERVSESGSEVVRRRSPVRRRWRVWWQWVEGVVRANYSMWEAKQEKATVGK